MAKKTLISGIQPSGNITIGNYIGAIKYFLSLQDDYECYYMMVDLHAITVKQDPLELRSKTYDLLALYLAFGLDPEKSTIFVQSHVPAHTELGWVLNCQTSMGELQRMTQFKDKSEQHADNINAGLFGYPVLMAADILLYDTALVPVGDDQKQHLELTRDLAERFNKRFGETFTIPEPFIPPVGARIMSLQDPLKKMSKSDTVSANIITLLDAPDDIRKKMKRAVTDSDGLVAFDRARPGISNLITIYHVVSGMEISEIEQKYAGKGYGDFKSDLGEVVVAFLAPIQERFHTLRNDTTKLDSILASGALRANEHASKKLSEVYEKLGFVKKT